MKTQIPEVKKDYLLVQLDGDVFYNINGILEYIVNKKIYEYPHLNTHHLTMMNPKTHLHSFLYHALENMISHSIEIDGWFNAEWKQKFGDEEATMKVDILFYDEFCFLASEDLIRFDSYLCLTDEDIWINFSSKDCVNKYPEIKSLYEAKDLDQLKKAYRKLVMQWHPDIIGENDIIRNVTDAFLTLKKKFRK